MIEKWVESTRGRTYYWISRRPGAPAIVFLHGLTENHMLFESQLRYFCGRFTVLAWDSPAHGKSRPYKAFSYLHCAVELKSILDKEGIDRCTLVGQSLGGYQAQVFMAHWPQRVSGFAAIDSCPFGLKYYSKSALWWLKQVEWMARLVPHALLVRAVAHNTTRTQSARQNMRDMLQCYDKRELCHLMGLGYMAFTRENCDLEIPCPAILLLGEHDHTGKVRAYVKAWHEASGIPLFGVKGAAHNANADNPTRVNRILHAFFNSLPRDIAAAEEKPELRAMTAADWPAVADILAEAIEEGRNSFRTQCPDYAQFDGAHLNVCRRVILGGGRIAGFCALSASSVQPAYRGVAKITLIIDGARRGEGHGAVLLADVIRESERAGIWTLTAEVFASDDVARHLLEISGFHLVGIRERIACDRFGVWQDTALYERRRAED